MNNSYTQPSRGGRGRGAPKNFGDHDTPRDRDRSIRGGFRGGAGRGGNFERPTFGNGRGRGVGGERARPQRSSSRTMPFNDRGRNTTTIGSGFNTRNQRSNSRPQF